MTDQINKKNAKSHNKHNAAPRKGEQKSLEVLFFRIGETEFCARKGDLIDITGGNIISHLPLTPAYFDGVVDLNGATTYVFDLAALIGITSSISAREGTLLIISKKNPPAAFRVDEIIGHAIIKNEAIIPIPTYLKSEFIDVCAIHDEQLIPIINLKIIFKSILSKRIEAHAQLSLSLPAKVSNKKLSKKNTRFFLLGEETFAALDFDPTQPLFKFNDIAIIPGTPDFVLGITLFGGIALTIIDTSLRLNAKKSDGRKVLISKIGKDLFGFIVDTEKRRHKTTKDKTLELPHLTRKVWMTSAIFTEKEIIPILKLSSLLSPEEPIDKEILAKSYRPDPVFEQSFFKQKVNVTELILMGKHHALPATEVKEVITLKRYRNLPGLPSIVIGVSEHKGALLPVIDMGACFGIKSEMTKSWKMIHLENGDFSALVITKATLDEKELPLKLHRKMPLMMKHRFLYGCYPNNEAKMISLTLNVYKMAVYFDEEMLKEIFKSSISGVKEDKMITDSEPSSTQSDAPLNAPDNLNDQTKSLDTESLDPTKDTVGSSPITNEQKDGSEAPNKQHDAPINTEEAKPSQSDTQFNSLDESNAEAEPLNQPKHPGEVPSTMDKQKNGVETIKGTEEKIKEADSIAANETSHTDPVLSVRPVESTQDSFSPKVSNVAPSSSVASKKLNTKNGDYTKSLKHTKSRSSSWMLLSIILLLCIALFSFFWPGSDSIRKQANIKPQITTIKEHSIKNDSFEKKAIARPALKKDFPSIIKIPAIDDKTPPTEKKEAGHAISKTPITEQADIQSEDYLMKTEAVEQKNNPTPFIPVETIKPVNKDVIQTLKPKKWKRNKNKYYPPLGEFDFYTVEEGDTLWDIAEAYSKNPYDYNLVAEDNKIIDPDLIYPGQRLRLQKKLKVDKAVLPEQNKVVP